MASSRLRYVVVRLLQTAFMLWFILTFLFFLFRLMPGSYTDLMLSQGADQETIETFRRTWGLDDPLYVQYGRFIINYLQFDVGQSLAYRTPVWEFVKMKIFNTMILVAPGITAGYFLGSIFGAVLGSKRGSRLEKTGIIALTTSSAFPGFFVGIVLILIFATTFDLVPSSGMISPTVQAEYADAPWWRPYLTMDFFKHWILPFSVLVFRGVAGPTLIMRTSVVEVTGQDFSYYHKVSGLPYPRRLRHIGKHAILPVITLFPVSLARAISGLVVLEIVFNWPGIGWTLVQAVFSRDFPIVQFVFFITAAFIVVGNFVVDILYGVIDPRVSVGD